jgi:hypothetical protein
MNAINKLLVTTLGQSDAVWLPIRQWDTQRGGRLAVIAGLRRRFARRGVPWHPEAHTEAARKSAQRLLGDVARAGLVTATNPTGRRTIYVRLTQRGDRQARMLCGLTVFEEARGLLDRLLSIRDSDLDAFIGHGLRPPDEADAGEPVWHSEQTLTGTRWGDESSGYRKAMGLLELDMLPLLTRRLVLANSDIHGRTWYALSPEGLKLARQRHAAGEKDPGEMYGDDEVDGDAITLYYQARQAQAEAFSKMHAENPGELGMVPFTCSPYTRRVCREAEAKAG